MRSAVRRFCASLLGLVAVVVFLAAGQGESQGAVALQHMIVTGPGPGGGPHVALFKASDARNQINFFAYAPGFSGGVDVALGDLDGDGRLEIITGPGPGGGPHVRVFTDHGVPVDKWSFFAYGAGFGGGVNVGVADIDGDEDKEILTAPATGGPPLVRVWNIVGDKAVQAGEFLAYGPEFQGGVDVDGAYMGATKNEGIVTGAGPGGGPHVRTFNSNFTPFGSWFAYDPAYTGGVTVTAIDEDLNPASEIATASRTARGHVRSFSVAGAERSANFYAWDAAVDAGASIGSIGDNVHGPFVIAPFRAGGARPCNARLNPPNCERADWFRGVDLDGEWTIQNTPYGETWRGGMRIAGGYGFFDDYGTVFNPTTTSTSAPATTSTTAASTTTSSTSTSTSTSTTAAP